MNADDPAAVSFQFVGPLPVWAAVLLALAAATLAWRFYAREGRHLPRRLRWGLPALRALAFALGVLLLCAPVLKHRRVEGELGRVRVLVDGSASMALHDRQFPPVRKLRIAEALGRLPVGAADRYDATPPDARPTGDETAASAAATVDSLPRWRRAELLLSEGAAPVLPALRERHAVTLRSLRGADAVPLDLPGEEEGDADEPDLFPLTDLATGLTDGAAPAGERAGAAAAPRSAVVLLTDGRHNAGPSPTDAARALGEAGAALFPVVFGSDDPAADLAVVAVTAPDLLFKTDRLRGTVTVRDTGPAGTPFTAEVVSGDAVLWREDFVTTGAGDRAVPFEFPLDAEPLSSRLAAGGDDGDGLTRTVAPLDLTVRLSPLPGEADAANNARPLRVAVTLAPRRALLLDGRPRWETRYLRNALARDPRWAVTTVIHPDPTAPLPRGDAAGPNPGGGEGAFPATRDGLLAYDLILFGELPPALLTAEECRWLREFVERRGGGLVFIDGRRGALGELPSPVLTDLLPVARGGEALPAPATELRPTPAGAATGALRMDPDDDADARAWAALPAPKTLIAAEASPGSETLLEAVVDGAPRPAVVTRAFGAGRVLYLAFDETWRWRYRAADTHHQRLWNQLAGFVMPRPYAVRDELLALDAGPATYAPGASATVRAELRRPAARGAAARPAAGAVVDAVLTRDGRVVGTVPLTEDPAVPGAYRGATGPLEPGDHEVSVRAAGFPAGALQARAGFRVEPPANAEAADTAANPALLAAMGGGVRRHAVARGRDRPPAGPARPALRRSRDRVRNAAVAKLVVVLRRPDPADRRVGPPQTGGAVVTPREPDAPASVGSGEPDAPARVAAPAHSSRGAALARASGSPLAALARASGSRVILQPRPASYPPRSIGRGRVPLLPPNGPV